MCIVGLVDAKEVIARGGPAWNEWRRENPKVLIDLRGAHLRGADLVGALLEDVVMSGADCTGANMRNAKLNRTDLRGASLTGADLRDADLTAAILGDIHGASGNTIVDITDADFTGARFGWTVLGDVYLNRMTGIGQARHAGPSYITTSTLEFTVHEITRTGSVRTDVELFLRGCGVLLDAFKEFEQGLRTHAYRSCFISYSHKDKLFALWLLEQLEKAGVRCWLDEKTMLPGERILDALAKAVSSNETHLLVCSKNSLQSWWVKDELRKALELERRAKSDLRVLPILLDNYLLEEWDDGMAADLRSRLAVDMRTWDETKEATEMEMGRLLRALHKLPRKDQSA